ncbi:hypothetical protein [Arthrobacter sp. NPDC080082]|uniref:hypothetical protein n=1 Tax=unclassified Arthrobacter TaxID=235627 RepID=UPI00341BF870
MTHYRQDDWKHLLGAFVEIRKDGALVRKGLVDAVMPDSSALWIAAEGLSSRGLIDAAEGYEVWVEPRQLEGRAAYRMTASALRLRETSQAPGCAA